MNKILNFRRLNGITQIELAKMAGVSPTTIARIERGGKPSIIVEGKLENAIDEYNERMNEGGK